MKYINTNNMKSQCCLWLIFIMLFNACNMDDGIVDVEYPDAVVYMSQAATAKYRSEGIYTLNSNVYNQTVNFSVNSGKIIVPIGIIRSGVNLTGDVTANISVATDTVSKLIAANKFNTTTVILPSADYTLPPSVTVKSGEINSKFDMLLDLDFFVKSLQNTPEQQYAIAVTIITSNNKQSKDLATTIFALNPTTILSPVADFFSYTYNDGAKTAFINNKSVNGFYYVWDFGDGTPLVTTDSPDPHKYTAAGTYTIQLTAKSAIDNILVSVKQQTIVIQ